jgi:hypothetical protein
MRRRRNPPHQYLHRRPNGDDQCREHLLRHPPLGRRLSVLHLRQSHRNHMSKVDRVRTRSLNMIDTPSLHRFPLTLPNNLLRRSINTHQGPAMAGRISGNKALHRKILHRDRRVTI